MSTTAKSNATTRRKPTQSAQERPAAQVVQFPLFAPKPRQTAPQEIQVVVCECGADAVRVRLLPDPAAVLHIMDETFGTLGWTRRYYFADGRLWCGVGVYHPLMNNFAIKDAAAPVGKLQISNPDKWKENGSFLAAAAQSGSVTYQNQQAEDITTRYMDTEARLASLTAQRTRLQELQAQADTLADLLEIESSLSDVQYQIESWQSQLDWYCNQVSCCTVYITLNEVETLTPTSTSFGAKLLAALRNGWTGFVSGAQAVAVFLVGAWPAILIGAVCGVIYYRVRHPRKKK